MTKAVIRPKVVAKLASVAHHTGDMPDKTRLHEDLGMGPTVRRAMALPYSRISAEYRGLAVTQSEAGDLETVGESGDLVYERANGRS